MRVEYARDYVRDYKQKCTDEIRTCEGLQAESVQMRLEHVRDYKQKVYQMRLEHVRDYKQKVYR